MGNAKNAPPHSVDPTELRRALDMMDFFAGMAEAEILREMRQTRRGRALPILLVGGFLGAGKTTLLQRLLTESHGLKLTAIVNDVAEINIDAQLITSANRDTIALANGCVCCSQSGELARNLAALADGLDRPDAIVVETSGVADLWTLAQIVARLEGCTLEGVVTVMDAAHPCIEETRTLMARQVAAADIVVLNKTDIATLEQVTEAEATLSRHAPSARIIRSVECSLPASVLFGPLGPDDRWSTTQFETEPLEQVKDVFATLSLQSDTPVNRKQLEVSLNTLPCPVLRAKGIMRFDTSPETAHVVHQVGQRREISPTLIAPTTNQLVLVGTRRETDIEALTRHLHAVGLGPIGVCA